MGVRGQGAGDRGQESGVRGQGSGGRGQGAGVGGGGRSRGKGRGWVGAEVNTKAGPQALHCCRVMSAQRGREE